MNITDLLISHEGLELKPYRCTAGKLTIGIGRNLDDCGISEDEARQLLANDIRACRADLARTYPWYVALDEVRQAACVDLRFNLGSARLAGFSKFLAAMHRGDYARAGAELVDSRWYGQVGVRGARVVKMIQLGEWP